MLIAESEKGKQINLSCLSRHEINQLRKTECYCPGCKEELIIKNGSIMMPHFAHKKNSLCLSFSENESEEHLKGKKIMADNCRKYKIEYEVEAYLPELNQRPDLLINHRIAIEFQCSPLSIERFKERTLNYQSLGYQVIWILGNKLQFKDKISQLQRQFIYLSKEIGFYVWEMDVEAKTIQNKYFLVSSVWQNFFQTRLFQLEKENFLSIVRFPLEKHPKISYEIRSKIACEKRIDSWNRQLNQKNKCTLSVQEYFYKKGLNIRNLPEIIILPSFQSVVLKEQEYIWRYQIYEFIGSNQKVTYQEIYEEIKGQNVESYCLISSSQFVKYHLSLYLCFLIQNRLVIRRDDGYYYTGHKLDLKKSSQEFLGIPLKYGMINK